MATPRVRLPSLADGRWAREPRVLGTSKIGGVISASCAPASSPEARAQAENWIMAQKHSQPCSILLTLSTDNSRQGARNRRQMVFAPVSSLGEKSGRNETE